MVFTKASKDFESESMCHRISAIKLASLKAERGRQFGMIAAPFHQV